MRFLSSPILLMLLALPVSADDWWNQDWTVRQRVYIDASRFQSNLESFPVTLRMPRDSASAGKMHPDGSDLRAISPDGNVLPLEVVRLDSAQLEFNVFVSRINAGQHQPVFDLYYGNPSAGAASASLVWDSPYRAVLHLEGDFADATPRRTAATPVGRVNAGDTASFGPDSGYLLLDATSLTGIADELTVTVRFRAQDQPTLQTLASGMRNDPRDWFNFGLKTPNVVHTNTTSRGKQSHELNPTGIAIGTWHAASVAYYGKTHTRTIAIDGVVVQRDTGLPGPLEIEELRIGRGLLHFDPWQFHGDMDEVRIADAARSADWLLLETACLSERNPFVSIGLPQLKDAPSPPPAPFSLLEPTDQAPVRTRNVTLQWQPSAGAESYRVIVYSDTNAAGIETVLHAGASTSLVIPYDIMPPGKPVRWSVVAQSQHGAQFATETRSINFYDWAEKPAEIPKNALEPALDSVNPATINVQGYLRDRIDRVIDRWFLVTPESSPAILQVYRDRDKSPVRDPLVPWAGEFAGKFLTAAQLNWRLTRDERLKAAIDAFVEDLIACQAEDGYLGPFPESTRLTGGNWDVWGHYHVMLGLMLYHEDTSNAAALETCRRMADKLFETFGPGGPTLTNDGAGGQMNMSACHGLVLLYKKTGIQRYLDLAMYIVNEAWNEPNAGQYLKVALAGVPIHEFPQHRWEMLHGIQALAELYWLTGNEDYRKAVEHIWWSCVRGDRHNTGGFTSGEGMVGSPYNLGAIETCCTVAWAALSLDMLRLTGDPRVADEIEWSTLNSALGAIPYSGRACAYNVPMDGTRVFGVELPWQAPKGGPDLNCCSVNAPRPLGMIAQWGVMQSADAVFVNYFGACTMTIPLSPENTLELEQKTDYPRNGNVALHIAVTQPQTFTLAFRIPAWSTKTSLQLNEDHPESPAPGTYHRVTREWKTGDIVQISFDFSPRFWAGDQECAGKVSVFRGPLLYAYDARYNTIDPDQLPAVDPRDVRMEEAIYKGNMPPWALMRLDAGAGRSCFVVDVSSAGQTGNHYRTWLPAANLPPAPFAVDRPVDGACNQRLEWQAAANAANYSVSISNKPDMEAARVIEGIIALEVRDLGLSPGIWYFRVAAMNEHGTTIASNAPLALRVP